MKLYLLGQCLISPFKRFIIWYFPVLYKYISEYLQLLVLDLLINPMMAIHYKIYAVNGMIAFAERLKQTNNNIEFIQCILFVKNVTALMIYEENSTLEIESLMAVSITSNGMKKESRCLI